MNLDAVSELVNDESFNFLKVAMKKVEKTQVNDDKEISIDDSSPVILEKILIVARNLGLIVKHLKDGRSARIDFMKHYPQWYEKRKRGIEKLKEIASAINSDRFNCNISRLVSSLTSVTGGGLMLASAILIPFTGGLSLPFGIAGGVLTSTGSVAAIGTSVTELIRDKAHVDEAQQIIKEDKELYEKMSIWMEHADKLNAAQTEVLEIDIIKDIVLEVKKLVDKGMKIENVDKRSKYIEKKVKKIMKHTRKKIMIPLIGIKTLVSLLTGMFVLMSNVECRILFDCASLTVKALTGAVILIDEITDLASLICTNLVSKTVVQAAARGTFAAIGITLDIASIALTSIDIHKGSFSSQAKKISDVANEMEKEAEVLENVYNNVINSESRIRA